MKKIRNERWILFSLIYILFTAACNCLSFVFPAHRILMIQVWYQISVILWIFGAVMAVGLLIRFQKTNKPKMRRINERSEKS